MQNKLEYYIRMVTYFIEFNFKVQKCDLRARQTPLIKYATDLKLFSIHII